MTTAVETFAGGSTAANFTLIFSGTQVGDWIEDFDYKAERLTEINERQNLWADRVILDGRYPALIHRYTFQLYTQTGSIGGLFAAFTRLNSIVTSNPGPLTVRVGTPGTVVYNYGLCYFNAPANPVSPQRFNRHEAMVFEVNFTGKTSPTVT